MSFVDEKEGIRSGVEDGVEWKVLLGPLGSFCNGYARIPAGHPWSGLEYDAIDVEVHGGLTFGDGGWIGFDTAHAWDVWSPEALAEVGGKPSIYGRVSVSDEERNSWTAERVAAEAANLARQIARAAS